MTELDRHAAANAEQVRLLREALAESRPPASSRGRSWLACLLSGLPDRVVACLQLDRRRS